MRFLVDWIVLATGSMAGLADVGRETVSLLGLPCLFAARVLTCIAGVDSKWRIIIRIAVV